MTEGIWKRRCFELAEIVNRHYKDRMHSDMKLGWEKALWIMEFRKLENKANKMYLKWWKCGKKKKREILWDEYQEMANILGPEYMPPPLPTLPKHKTDCELGEFIDEIKRE